MWHDSGTGADIAHLIFYSANFYTTTAVSIIDDHPPTTPLFLYLPYQNVRHKVNQNVLCFAGSVADARMLTFECFVPGARAE
eukprot:COSAG01_NODE_7781_length_3060_cov_3.303951_2_plen_82_part_00